MNTSEKTNDLLRAMANFQQLCPILAKDTAGYGYKYVSYPDMLETIRPILKKCGLAFFHAPEGDGMSMTIYHVESGQYITSTMNIPHGVTLKGMNDFQVLGSGITYCIRYMTGAMLGIASEKDEDAAGEQTGRRPDRRPQDEGTQDGQHTMRRVGQ